MSKKYYITTPIYYPSGNWHLGHCYTTVCCDALARFKRLQGYDVYYLTGTDEHGQKIQERARQHNIEPKEFVDGLVSDIKKLWKLLDISYTKFIRTTDDEHKAAVQKIFSKLYEKGDIYKSSYEGWYCTPCESYWTQTQLKDGKCPDCGREVKLTKEDSYFFRLSKYQDRVEELLTKTEFLEPKSRVNEMVNNFIKPGLADLSVSRTSFDWGVKVPFDSDHVIYVWIDALSNYITALGYTSDDESDFETYWPADLHMMGKEIIRFHTIIWPAILMALELPLPKKAFAHGWIMLGGDKMSKSKGNVVDPFILVDRYGLDAVRYYLLTALPADGTDGAYTNEAFIKKINTDLVNTLGNLVSRTIAMTEQYFDGAIPSPEIEDEIDQDFANAVKNIYSKVTDLLEKIQINKALEEIILLTERANKYIDQTLPWVLAKDPDKKGKLKTVIYNLCECIRTVAVLLRPFLIKTPDKIFEQLGVNDEDLTALESAGQFPKKLAGCKVKKGEILFPRLKLEKELEELSKLC
ncbi:MAG: methionine--tRNA ligase [Clostridiales bacterium]|jgi:methionyl-tRNA synthetase|nr:methionine--tRNA ligase [Clostridiales bacterium]